MSTDQPPPSIPDLSHYQFGDEGEGIDFGAYRRFVVRGWWILILGMLVAGGASYWFSNAQTPIYESSTRILVQNSGSPGVASIADTQGSSALAESFEDLVTTPAVLEAAFELVSPTGGLGRISVNSRRSSIRITVEHPDPQVGADVANAVARSFVDDFQQRQFAKIAQFQASLSQYGIESDQALIAAAQAATLTTLTILEEAKPASSPSSPRTRSNVILAVIAGLLLAGFLVVLREHLDDHVRSPEELQNLLGPRNLAGVAAMTSVDMYRAKGGARPLILEGDAARSLTEAYKFLQTNLEFATVGTSGLSSLLVTSSGPEEGKTTTAINLATSMANEGRQVILVDADLRRPSLQHIFTTNTGQKGLTHLLLGTGTVAEVSTPTSIPGLRVVVAGALPADPPQVLRSSRMREVVAELLATADMVILDSPPLLAVTDPMLLVPLVDGVLFVVDASRTRRNSIRRSLEMLRLANPRMVGAILNKVHGRAGSYGNYYYYQYGVDARDPGTHGLVGILTGKRLLSALRKLRRRSAPTK